MIIRASRVMMIRKEVFDWRCPAYRVSQELGIDNEYLLYGCV